MLALPLVLTLDLPEATPSNNTLKNMHYRVYSKLRRGWQAMVQGAVQRESGSSPEPVERCYLTIERHSAGGGLDWDNAFGGLKPLLDCLVVASAKNPDGLGLIADDNPRNMPFPPGFKQLKAKPGHGRTVVRIYDAKTLDHTPPSWV